MKRCPMCGSPMGDKQKSCIACDYVEPSDKVQICPQCGEMLNRGVCYKCGYRKKRSSNVCPYCNEKLVAGRCQRCGYKYGQGFIGFIIFIAIVLIPIILIIINN